MWESAQARSPPPLLRSTYTQSRYRGVTRLSGKGDADRLPQAGTACATPRDALPFEKFLITKKARVYEATLPASLRRSAAKLFFVPGVVDMADSTVSARNLWQNALEQLRNDGQPYVVSQLMQLQPMSYEGGALTLGVEDLFFRDWVDDHYSELMSGALTRVIGHAVKVLWQKVEKGEVSAPLPAAPPVSQLRRPARLRIKWRAQVAACLIRSTVHSSHGNPQVTQRETPEV